MFNVLHLKGESHPCILEGKRLPKLPAGSCCGPSVASSIREEGTGMREARGNLKV